MNQARPQSAKSPIGGDTTEALLGELVAYFRQKGSRLREEWVQRIIEAKLLSSMTREEITAEIASFYDRYLDALEAGNEETLRAYARNLSERITPRGVETHEVLGVQLLLRPVLWRELVGRYSSDLARIKGAFDVYDPPAGRLTMAVSESLVQERERVIRLQQEAIRELSTPVLPVRERLLILPIIGVIDPMRARQLTEQLLCGIRANRAKVVVMDVTGVPAIDRIVANHLVQTVEAARLLGAIVIVTGLSPEIAQTLVAIGEDLGKMNTVGDLQEGLEEAERLLGYQVILVKETAKST